MRTSQLNVGTSTDVSLKITESDLSQLTASIRAPSGNEEPCLLKRLPNRHIGEWAAMGRASGGGQPERGQEESLCQAKGSMSDPRLSTGISFTPKEVGEHVVSVRKSGKHVTNSPFKILVGPSEIGDASKVRVWGKGLSEGQTFQVAEFIVDTRNAGASCPQRPLMSAGASTEDLSFSPAPAPVATPSSLNFLASSVCWDSCPGTYAGESECPRASSVMLKRKLSCHEFVSSLLTGTQVALL